MTNVPTQTLNQTTVNPNNSGSILTQNNVKNYIMAGLFFVAVIAGISIYMSRKATREASARNAFFTAQLELQKEIKKITDDKTAALNPETPVGSKNAKATKDIKKAAPITADITYDTFDVSQKLSKSVELLQNVKTQFAGTVSSLDASMLLGNLYYDHGQVEQSIPYFEYVTQNTTDSLKKTMSLYSWGYALENTHHCDQAIKKYEQALSLGEVSMKQDLTQAKQRCQK